MDKIKRERVGLVWANGRLAGTFREVSDGLRKYLLGGPVIYMRGNGLNTAHYIEAFQVGDAYLDKLKVLF